MTVEFLPKVVDYFEELALVLHANGYFGSYEFSWKYVDKLIDKINTTLPISLHKPAPKQFDKYGKNMKYAGFSKNRRTIWYVFFTTYERNGGRIYLVHYIANNQTIAQYLR